MAELPVETLTTAEKTGIRDALKCLGSDPALVTEFTGTRITNKIACTKAQFALIADPGASYPTTEFTFTDGSMSDYGYPVIGEWTCDTGSTAATPDAGQLRWNNATQTSATSLYLDGLTASAIDMAAILLLVSAGNQILIQSGAANYQLWSIRAAPSVSSGNWTFPVKLDSSAGTGTTGFTDGDALIVGIKPRQLETIGRACSDLTTVLTAGEKAAFDIDRDFVVTRVYASLAVAPTGSALTLDVEDEGTSILNAVLSIGTSNNNAETSTFASSATYYVLSKGDRVTIDIDSVGGANAGLEVHLEGFRP